MPGSSLNHFTLGKGEIYRNLLMRADWCSHCRGKFHYTRTKINNNLYKAFSDSLAKPKYCITLYARQYKKV